MLMLDDSKCKDCPAFALRTLQQIKKIKKWHSLFEAELKKILDNGGIKVILLGESYPEKRYIYDLTSHYYNNWGLVPNLLKEFNRNSRQELFKEFITKGIIVYDTAYCPLHKLNQDFQMRNEAATYCFRNYKLDFIKSNDAPIISFFPKGIQLDEKTSQKLKDRIKREYQFSKLHGLRNEIKNIRL